MAQTDFMSAIRQIAAERKIEVEEIVDAIKEAILTSFSSEYPLEERERLSVEIDPEEGQIAVFVKKDAESKVTDEKIQISLAEAKKINPKVKEGQSVSVDITPKGDFGRIAAQTARQVILQKLREAEKDAVIRQIQDKVGTIVSVIVQKITQDGAVICELNRARAIMPKNERIMSEFYKIGSTIKVLLKSIEEDDRENKYILISRADPKFLIELFKIEVPEIDSGTVEIVAVAREEGSRSKVAVRSLSDGVDPIGSCVGQRGVRINAISNELKSGPNEEKIDIILWDDNIETFLMNSIRPAESIKVIITDKKAQEAIIVVPDMQQSLAIGKDGQNVRLAAKLTEWKIDVKSEAEINGTKPEKKTEEVAEATEEAKEESEETKE